MSRLSGREVQKKLKVNVLSESGELSTDMWINNRLGFLIRAFRIGYFVMKKKIQLLRFRGRSLRRGKRRRREAG